MNDIDMHLLREKIVCEVEQWKEKTANHYTIEAETRWSEANYILGILDSLRQEQSKVDLEEEITRWLDEGDITDTRFDDYDDSDIERTARHFYELGKNSK
jgi:hypothetical protein